MAARIRVANCRDSDAIRDVYMAAFPEGEDQSIAKLATQLLDEQTDPATFALVAETDGSVVGHIAFSPVTVGTRADWLGYILAPLGVKPGYQGRGIGSMLVKTGIARLSEQGVNVLFVYGDPEYYERFGFRAETAARFRPPYTLKFPFGWQAVVLRTGAPGQQGIRLACVAPLRDPALW